MHFAFFQPDIPQNVGAALRLASCFNVCFHIIEPCGFILSDKRIRRSGLDYTGMASLIRHSGWSEFLSKKNTKTSWKRIILFSTKAQQTCYQFKFHPEDMLLFGRESSGAPEHVHQNVDYIVRIPISTNARSLNIVTSAAIGLSEALRQTKIIR